MSNKENIMSTEPNTQPEPIKRKHITIGSAISLVFVILFMCIISAFPIMYFCGVSAGKNYEKKALANAPKLDELINNYTGFADTFEQHFNDYFPLRSNMLELYSYLEYKAFNTSLLPNYTSIGKKGWLFFESDRTRPAVSGQRMLSAATLENIYNGIMEKYNILNAMGKKYIIYLAAEKQMVYPEYDRLENAEYTLIDQLREYLNSKNCPVPFIYSKDYLLTKKTNTNQLYYKYDTHWNLLGAHYGYENVMTKIKEMLPEKDINVVTEFDLKTSKRSGDLATTLFLSKYLVEETPVPIYQYTPTYKKVGPVTHVTSAVNSDLKVFIYGDSFAQADYWGAAFAQSASEIRILHNKNYFQMLLDNLGDCDVVVEECVQRVPTTLGRVFDPKKKTI